MWLRAILVCVALLAAGASSAGDCLCPLPLPPQKALHQAGAVFNGTVLSVEEGPGWRSVTMQVAETWKGATKATSVVFDPADRSCQVRFQVGQSYLVYASPEMQTSTCTRTKRLVDAAADLQALGPGTPVASP